MNNPVANRRLNYRTGAFNIHIHKCGSRKQKNPSFYIFKVLFSKFVKLEKKMRYTYKRINPREKRLVLEMICILNHICHTYPMFHIYVLISVCIVCFCFFFSRFSVCLFVTLGLFFAAAAACCCLLCERKRTAEQKKNSNRLNGKFNGTMFEKETKKPSILFSCHITSHIFR